MIKSVIVLFFMGSLALIPSQTEIHISSEAKHSQYLTHTAGAPNGDFIVAWQGDILDGDKSGIFARRFNLDGTPKGLEFQVNKIIANDQFVPSVAIDENGNFAIVWESDGSDGSGFGISCRLFSAEGEPLSDEFPINTTTADHQHDPSIAMAPSGDFVVTWGSDNQDGSPTSIFARRFNARGTALSGEFRVNTYTAGVQQLSSVAADSNGNFVIIWESEGQDGSGKGIYAQRFNSGGEPKGAEFRVNSYTYGDQSESLMSMNAFGDFIVVWGSDGQDGSGIGAYFQRFKSGGIPIGCETRVNTSTEGDQVFPAVAIDSSGAALVAWESELNAQSGNVKVVYFQLIDSAGVLKGSEFQVNTYKLSDQVNPKVALLSSGKFFVAWSARRKNGRGYDVNGNIFDNNRRSVFQIDGGNAS